MPLLLATTNPEKLEEIRAVLSGLPIGLRSLATFPKIAEPDETGNTFGENARDKALYYADATGLPAVADDSGLEIEALDGAPGVRSSRFPGASYPEKFRRIYRMLAERGARDSPARFVCAVALARPGEILFTAEHHVEGRIASEPRGTRGFGYDPIFFYPPYGATLAEVSPDEKHAISHRGQAFRALRSFLIECSWV